MYYLFFRSANISHLFLIQKKTEHYFIDFLLIINNIARLKLKKSRYPVFRNGISAGNRFRTTYIIL